ncbi:two component transcriptional regulator, LytTR family [Lachnospiraceae bacterium XPB1003]|nr:two component transcriptional regulator, LytTR family [Lachnospiraceae bacterium XPB1003]
MFRIAVCDDEPTSLQLNKMLTEQVLNEEGISYEIHTFDDIGQMANTLSKPGQHFDCLLSDILSTGMNGIEAAEKLRRFGEQLDIIFISMTSDYALDGYRVRALRYLKKPVDKEQLREALLLSYRSHEQKDGLAVNCEGKYYNLDYKDIYFFESQARDIEITLSDKKLTMHMKISDLEKILPEREFFRCHRSYIVNLRQVENIERYQATMRNGEMIPISQQQYTELKNRLSQ